MAEACLFTWVDVVHHQCQVTGEHAHHVCPCGANRVEATHRAAEVRAWVEAQGLTAHIAAEVAKAPPLPAQALAIIEAQARRLREAPLCEEAERRG